jgi:hypothetical protein
MDRQVLLGMHRRNPVYFFSKGEFHMTYILTALVVFVIGWQFHKFLENSTKK